MCGVAKALWNNQLFPSHSQKIFLNLTSHTLKMSLTENETQPFTLWLLRFSAFHSSLWKWDILKAYLTIPTALSPAHHVHSGHMAVLFICLITWEAEIQ